MDQSKLPGTKPLFSPRVGFNWNAVGDRRTQVRGGTGIFTGRVPFVWIGNVISNPGRQPESLPHRAAERPTRNDATLAQSFDLNAMDPDFKWPQVWTTDLAIDQQLPWRLARHARGDLRRRTSTTSSCGTPTCVAPVRTLPDGRPYYGGFGANELNPDGGAGIYVIDNTDEGYSFNVTAQLRKTFGFGAERSLGYSFTEAKNNLKSTEIASVLWQNQPVQGDPEQPGAELLGVRPAASHRRRGHRTRSVVTAVCGRRSACSSRSPKATASPAPAATATRSSTPAT